MIETIIGLLSIIVGIIAANVFGVFYKKYAFDLIGNSIAGVFGSILFIKTFARLGFDPVSIMTTGETNLVLLIINFIVAAIGAIVVVLFIKKLKDKI